MTPEAILLRNTSAVRRILSKGGGEPLKPELAARRV